MSKIVCEICGTTYPESAPSCPICGWSRKNTNTVDFNPEEFEVDFLNEETPAEAAVPAEEAEAAVVPVPAAVGKKSRMFDYDEVNGETPAAEPEEEDDEDDEEEEEEEPRTNTFLVVILVVLIVALLLVSGFIFWKYYLPNHSQPAESTEPSAAVVDVVPTTEATEPEGIPCTGLSLVSGVETFTFEGQNWLLHVKAVPEDTTDVITFESEDESVAVVNEEGRVTAVGEGETRIVIKCGEQVVLSKVTVNYQAAETEQTENTEPAENGTTEAGSESEGGESAEATEATQPAEINPDIVLKLKRTDITIGRRGVYVELVLDCDLTPDQVTWTTRNPEVAQVNAKGEVTAVGPGLTVVTCTYGNQSVECIVRCKF